MTMEIRDPQGFLKALSRMGIRTYVSGKPKEMTLEQLAGRVATCTRCGLGKSRWNAVFGEGNERAELLFVGEAPGEEEDMQGRPFVGRAGKLLDQLIERIGLSRKDVYICNVLKCRPPNNRDPEATEAEACESYLRSQIEIVQPLVICTLGRHAYNTLLCEGRADHEDQGDLHRVQGHQGPPHVPSVVPAEEPGGDEGCVRGYGEAESIPGAGIGG